MDEKYMYYVHTFYESYIKEEEEEEDKEEDMKLRRNQTCFTLCILDMKLI